VGAARRCIVPLSGVVWQLWAEQRAEDDGTKKSVIRVYLPVSDDTQQRLFGVSVVSPTGTTVSATSSLHTSTAAEVLAFSPMLEAVAAAFNAGFSTWFTATACNSYIEFESANTGLVGLQKKPPSMEKRAASDG